jgi:PAS domain S-box-containing protein
MPPPRIFFHQIFETVPGFDSLLYMLAVESTISSGAPPCLPPATQDRGRQDFLRLADSSPAMIWMADQNGLCTFANQTWLEFRGRELEQELGFGWAEGIHPHQAGRCLREYFAAVAAGKDFRLEYRILRGDGSYCLVENAGAPWLEAEGQPRGYVGRLVAVSASEERANTAAQQLAFLSKREREVLSLIALGYATKEAAAKLGVCYKTADSHRSHVLQKLGVHETASLVRFAIRCGLIAP